MIAGRPKPEDPSPHNEFWVHPDVRHALQYYRPPRDIFFPDHSHSEYNLVVCLQGSITVEQLGQSLTLEPGEALIGNAGQIHSSRYSLVCGGCQAVSLMVRPRLLTKVCREFDTFRGIEEGAALFTGKVHSDRLRACAADVASEFRAQFPGMAASLDALAVRMLIEMLRAWSGAKVERQPASEEGFLPRWEFVRAFELMQGATKDLFNVESLARQVGSSSSRFARLFSASTRQSPANYFNELLLGRARSMLGNPALPVKEIAYDLGFRSDSQFCTSFRQRFGLSPSQYRAVLINLQQKF